MTKNEFLQKFNQKYLETLTFTYDPQIMEERLKKYATDDDEISGISLFAESLMVSAEFSRNLIYSVLTDIFELPD